VESSFFSIFVDMKEDKKSVLLGMSGGTDSSVSAMLLLDAGYEVTGVTFRFYEKDGNLEYLDDARALAARLGIRHITYDARDAFRQHVISYFLDEYLAGRTPVPCVVCNNMFKWPLLARIADSEGIDFIATGHYVRKRMVDGRWFIIPGADSDKDQSFFLWGLGQDILSRMVLPMGDITKVAARALAAERGFSKVSTKRDSLGVCFCPMDYRSFLRESDEFKRLNIGPGDFVDESGAFIARHEGYPFYTIGQRRGLGIDLNRAVFVKEIDTANNRIVLSNLSALEKHEMWLKDWNMVDEERVLNDDRLTVKIRYRKQHNTGRVELTSDGRLHVILNEPLAAVANGQAAALFQGELLVGGGIIDSSL
jgi:tRNA-specific 2-thiouridylase